MSSIRRITPAPVAPQPGDTSDAFNGKAFPFAAWLAGLAGEYNGSLDDLEALVATLTTSGFTATSAEELTIATGVMAFVASPGAAFVSGQSLVMTSTASPANSMTGTVITYDAGTGEISLDITSKKGAGTFSDWTIGLALTADLSGYLEKAGGVVTGLLTLAAGIGLLFPPGAAPVGREDGRTWREAGKWMHRIGAVDFEVALVERAQKFYNKELVSPVISAGTISAATISGGTISGATISGGTIGGAAIAQRVVSAGATTGTLTPNCGTTDVFRAAGLTGAVTVGVPTGAPVSEQKLILYFDDNGTSRTITWSTGAGGFRAAKDVVLPTGTTAGKWLRAGCIWNADDGFWDVVAVVAQA